MPFADRVMFLTRRFSTLIRPNRRAMSVVFFSVPVLTPVGLPRLDARDAQPHLPSAGRAAFGAGELAFQPPEPGLLPPGQAGNVEPFPGGQGRTDRHTPVDAHSPAVPGGGHRRGNRGEGDMPAPGPIQRHPVRLHILRGLPGPAEPHPPGLRYPYLGRAAVQPTHVTWTYMDNTESLVPARLTPGWAAVCPGEEACHRLGMVADRLLLHDHTARSQPRVFCPGLGKLTAPFREPRHQAAARPPVRFLLHAEVPHVPGMRAVPEQHCLLRGRGSKTVTRHTATV